MQFLGLYIFSHGLVGYAAFAQPQPAPQYAIHPQRLEAIRAAFRRGWEGYREHAFPHDTLLPVTNGFADDLGGWGATAIDALSTALIMKEKDIAQDILEFIPTINYNKTHNMPEGGALSLFETTIRHMGGLISAYDLLKNPLKGLLPSQEANIDALLAQATQIADNLAFAFDTPSGIPDGKIFLDPPRIKGAPSNTIADIGTLVLEWTRLSDLTGNKRYAELTQRAEEYLLNPQPQRYEVFPGLLGTQVSTQNGTILEGSGGWGAFDDSFYEYLLKMYIFDSARFPRYRERWELAADSTVKHLEGHPSSRPDLSFLAGYKDGKSLVYSSQHLTCFAGGNFILGGLTLDNSEYLDFGLRLTAGCRETYAQTVTGVGPEIWEWRDLGADPNAVNSLRVPDNETEFFAKSGFWPTVKAYILRPEVMESVYYAYRATGDPKYQEWAWEMFLAIDKT